MLERISLVTVQIKLYLHTLAACIWFGLRHHSFLTSGLNYSMEVLNPDRLSIKWVEM